MQEDIVFYSKHNTSYTFSVNELDSGQFGVVLLGEAVGISAFRPRDILKERQGGGRLSFFWRKAKRKSYLHSKEITNVAVKCIKGLNLILH